MCFSVGQHFTLTERKEGETKTVAHLSVQLREKEGRWRGVREKKGDIGKENKTKNKKTY